jgi:nitroreductase
MAAVNRPASVKVICVPIHLNLSADEVLSTTRAVRRRFDLTRPVEREVLEECLRLAQQAPSGSNMQNWHFVAVTDAETRARLAGIWRRGAESYRQSIGSGPFEPSRARIYEAVWYLADHLHEVPVHVIPCIEGRTDGAPGARQAGKWASVIPAAWSFMLAARERGLGTVWTTFHLNWEREASKILGIPYDDVMQAALIPVAYTIGTDFSAARREPLDTMVHWDRW